MEVPLGMFRGGRRQRLVAAAALCSLALTSATGWAGEKKAREKKSGPWLQLPLEDMGFPGVSNALMGTGVSMLTVHFLDSSHLLVTFGLRSLIPRIADDPVDHDDRVVAAEVVELPTGKVLARTEWRMHDHGRYLWSLGNGRILVRIGERLSIVTPLAQLKESDPFRRTAIPGGRGRRPVLVEVSPEGGLVTMETVLTERTKDSGVVGDQDTAKANKGASHTAIDFYRVSGTGSDDDPVKVSPVGSIGSKEPFLLPIDEDGYLWSEQVDNNTWTMTFDEFGGKTVQLGKIQSSCQPRLQLLDRSEFLAMTCQGMDEQIKMLSYGFDGKETWEENLGDYGSPTFAYAPAAGRFAVSHIATGVGGPTISSDPPVDAQEVRVFQNASGDLLLKVESSPIFKTAENFDLSADGMLAAVVRKGAIAIYKLPALSKLDREDLAEAEKFAPPQATGKVDMKRLTRPVAEEAAMVSGSAKEAAQREIGDEQGTVRRPPTLLNPGEKPEFGIGNAQPESTKPQ